jgi:hypothetical protein
VSIIKNYRQSSSLDDENMNILINNLMGYKNDAGYQEQKERVLHTEERKTEGQLIHNSLDQSQDPIPTKQPLNILK